MNADGSGKRLLTRSTSHLYGWSPDGRKIAFGRWRDGNDDIHVMNADGSGQRNLTRTRNALNQGARLVARRAEDRVHEDQRVGRAHPRSTS